MSREDFVGPGHATGAGGFAIAPPAPIDPAQVGVLLGSVREQGDGELETIQRQVAAERAEKLRLQQRLKGGQEQIRQLQQQTQAALLAAQNDPERLAKQKKLDKYKAKCEKLKLEEQARERNHAKKLMAKLHPDRVPVEACKDGMRRRFQLEPPGLRRAGHALLVCAAPAPLD
eukprot:gene18088-67189_t